MKRPPLMRPDTLSSYSLFKMDGSSVIRFSTTLTSLRRVAFCFLPILVLLDKQLHKQSFMLCSVGRHFFRLSVTLEFKRSAHMKCTVQSVVHFVFCDLRILFLFKFFVISTA